MPLKLAPPHPAYDAMDQAQMRRSVEQHAAQLETALQSPAFAYTPQSHADPKGSAGAVAYDGSYLYVKTAAGGWLRAALTSF